MKKTTTLLIAFLLISSFMVLSEHTATSQQPTENTWKSLKPIPQTDTYKAVTVNGQIHLLSSRNHYVYNPNKDEWTTKKTMTTARNFFGITVYHDKIYVIGGTYGSDGEYFTSDAVEVYDLKTDNWETKASMLTARSSLCANEVDGKIYLIGGRTGGPSSIVGINEVYDITTDTWTTKKPLHNPVDAYASAVVDGKIYVLGGFEGLYHRAPVDFTQIYDPKTDTWSRGAQMPNITCDAAAGATSGLLAPKQIYVIGGGQRDLATNAIQIYNPATDTWTIGADMPSARCALTVAVSNDIIYAIGGMSTALGPPLTTNERYVPYGYGALDQTHPGELLEFTLLSPQNKTYYGPMVALEFSSKTLVDWTGYKLDDGLIIEAQGNTTLENLPLGQHRLTVYTTDTSGNLQVTQTIHFTTEKTQPKIIHLELAIIIIVTITIIIGAGLLYRHKKRERTVD